MLPNPLRSLLAFTVVAAAAQAQELEEELRPKLAVLEIVASDGDSGSVGRARQLEAELLEAVAKSGRFQAVLTPAQVKSQLGETLSCTELDCFKTARAKLKVDRLVRLTVQRQEGSSLVTVLGFDPSLPALRRAALDSAERAEPTFLGLAGRSRAERDRDFLKRMVALSLSAVNKLGIANGKLVVLNRDPAVTVLLDGETVGTGHVELVLQRGPHTVSITSTLYEPFTQTVSVEPLKVAEVDVPLVAKPVGTPAVAQLQVTYASTPIAQRPGLYVALAGAVAAAVGVGLGVSTLSVQSRIDAGGKPVAVTRAEAVAAETNAVRSSVLIGGGAALTAGGLLWVALTPVKRIELEPTESVGPQGCTLHVGGTF
jgi:hypothetical protein